MVDDPTSWEIELEEAIPYSGAKSFWHCRIQNRDLGYVTANDGDTQEQAVSRAKMAILERMRSDMADLLNEMEKVINDPTLA